MAADSFITCVQMATRAPACINYSWLARMNMKNPSSPRKPGVPGSKPQLGHHYIRESADASLLGTRLKVLHFIHDTNQKNAPKCIAIAPMVIYNSGCHRTIDRRSLRTQYSGPLNSFENIMWKRVRGVPWNKINRSRHTSNTSRTQRIHPKLLTLTMEGGSLPPCLNLFLNS
jgi:hypothetical protein